MNDNNSMGNIDNSVIAGYRGTLDITTQTQGMIIGQMNDFATRMQAMGYEIFAYAGRILQREVVVEL